MDRKKYFSKEKSRRVNVERCVATVTACALGIMSNDARFFQSHNDEVQFNFRGLELYVTYATTGEIAEWRAEREVPTWLFKRKQPKGIRMLLIIVADPTANTVIAAMTVGKDVSTFSRMSCSVCRPPILN